MNERKYCCARMLKLEQEYSIGFAGRGEEEGDDDDDDDEKDEDRAFIRLEFSSGPDEPVYIDMYYCCFCGARLE